LGDVSSRTSLNNDIEGWLGSIDHGQATFTRPANCFHRTDLHVNSTHCNLTSISAVPAYFFSCPNRNQVLDTSLVEHIHKTPPAPPTRYKHKLLNDKRRSMRILNLLLSSFENPRIECQLEVIQLDLDKPKSSKKITRGSLDAREQTSKIHTSTSELVVEYMQSTYPPTYLRR